MENEERTLVENFSHFKIGHTQYQNALEIIHDSIEATALRSEPACALLLGEPGTGKTSVCRQLMAEYGPPYKSKKQNKIVTIRPIVYCRLPNPITLKGLATSLIYQFNAKVEHDIMNHLDFRIQQLLRTCETQVIVIDELQHLLRRGASRTKEVVCDWLKVLSDLFGGEIILTGTPDCEEIIDRHDALSGRFPYRMTLTPFDLANKGHQREFFNLIQAFSSEIRNTMQFSEMTPLTNQEMFLALYAVSGGNMRSLRSILYSAIVHAFEHNRHSLTKNDFYRAAESVTLKTRLFPANPFDMSLSQLEKNLFRVHYDG
ncbi:TniB family NTP-binding protein [Pseudomonas sp. zfem002]|uniref:TniB family NTP-binding protein n=1 Tax=Pseudomonas sp. zfem002 TaxID=3078197 RepID=UPI002928352E|nr:TniB family NTP-binding protein [Pseudomonas sp. zfem002]MDU9393130.1 TniB family NTP-binding protein [Pseudomonas sp. zfem002]